MQPLALVQQPNIAPNNNLSLAKAKQAQSMGEFMEKMPPVHPAAPDLSLEEINALVHELRR
jgi:hypothetical protein